MASRSGDAGAQKEAERRALGTRPTFPARYSPPPLRFARKTATMRNPAPGPAHPTLAVDVPKAERDNPGWIKVGVIAAVGFVVGVAWPRVIGLRLGPSAPTAASEPATSTTVAAAEVHAPAVAPAAAAPAAAAPKAALPSPPVASPSTNEAAASALAASQPQVSIHRGSLLSCRTQDGEAKKGKDCGKAAGIDGVVIPRLRKIASCAAATGQTGRLSVVVTVDFPGGRTSHEIGKSSTVGNADALGACVKSQLDGATVPPQEHARYVVAYATTLSATKGEVAEPAPKNARVEKPSAPSPEERSEPAPAALATGEASVAWEVALVREVPKTGDVVGRLPRGTRVKVGAVKEGWYAVKYGENFAKDGWIYRGAIGR